LAAGRASGFISIAASPPASCIATFAAASRRSRSRFSLAARSALYSKTARLAAPLLGRSALTICPTPGRSSSARRAPRGSSVIASIEPARGPKPNRCSASAASLGLQAISVVPPKTRRTECWMLYAAAHECVSLLLPRQRFCQHLISLLVGPIVAQRRHDNAAGMQGLDVALRALLARSAAKTDPVIGQTARIRPRLDTHSLEQSDTLPGQGERAGVRRWEAREVHVEASRFTPADRK